MAWVASWLGRRDQIERMTRVSTTQLAPRPLVMCITISRLARYHHSGWRAKSALGYSLPNRVQRWSPVAAKTSYRIDDGDRSASHRPTTLTEQRSICRRATAYWRSHVDAR